MSDASAQITTTILAVIIVLLFFGVLFLVMLGYYNYRRRQTAREKKEMKQAFDQQLMLSRLEMQEQTFTFISEEIHDNVGQLLSLVKIQLSGAGESDTIDQELLKDARENVARAIRDLRNLAKGLHAGHIGALGIRQAAEEEGQRVARAGILSVSVTSEGDEHPLPEERQLILFRIIQECLQNCLKHAEATAVNIGFTWYPDQLRVRIRDDGKGFDPEATLQSAAPGPQPSTGAAQPPASPQPTLTSPAPGPQSFSAGLGLRNIRNRALVTGGSADIRSAPEEGTVVTVTMPYA